MMRGAGLRHLSVTHRFGALALACVLAVGLALIAQYAFGLRPCPWCILQRLIYLAIAMVCVLAALVHTRTVRIGLGLGALTLCVLGGVAALWQHQVAAKSASCNLTLADKILNALGVEALVPVLFQVTANCADAAVRVMGVAFEHWSLLLFALLAAGLLTTLRPENRQ